MKTFTLNILFVCTGNTCRSPMAEAIAVGLAEREEKEAPTAAKAHKGKGVEVKLRIRSAGVGATSGSPQTPEGVKAVRMLGYEGPKGGSRPLTREMIGEADLIYGMTRSHVAGVLAIDPSAKGKAMLLDPDGGEVADPIGLSQDAYNQVAGRLEAMIARRLKEWRP